MSTYLCVLKNFKLNIGLKDIVVFQAGDFNFKSRSPFRQCSYIRSDRFLIKTSILNKNVKAKKF